MIYNEGYNCSANGPGDTAQYVSGVSGDHITDRAGRHYIDLAMGGGSMILGHAPDAFMLAMENELPFGSIWAAPHFAVHEIDELLDTCIPWLPGRVWCNSGSEAVMRLVRIARAITGRRKIGLFSGCWHGSWDGTLVEEDYTRTAADSITLPVAKLKSAGIPPEVLDSIVFLPYRQGAAFNLIRENKDELACVLVEPVQGSNPSDDAARFLYDLRRVTQDCGVLLACDEVVTGFRLALGGGQDYFGVHADLAAYGKIIGGGLPVGMVAGRKDIMDHARAAGVFFGGTFSANTLTIAAGLATLRYLVDHPETYRHLDSAGTLLRAGVNQYCREHGSPAHMIGAGSISRLILTQDRITSRRERDMKEPDAAAQARFYADVRARGVWIGSNRIQFLSTAHGVPEIGAVVAALCASLTAAEWTEGR